MAASESDACGVETGWWRHPTRVLEVVRALLDLLWLLVCIRLKSTSVRTGSWSAVDFFAERTQQTPDAHALVSTASGEVLTFRGLDELSNQMAHWLMSRGVRAGDVVVLALAACPSYVALWLGVAKAGATAALVNVQLRGASLAHAVRTALSTTPVARHIVVCDGSAHAELVLADALGESVTVAVCGAAAPGSAAVRAAALALERELDARPRSAVDGAAREGVRWSSPLCLIYTSGTTGLPKASRFNHLRFWMAGKAMHVLCRLRAADRIYCALPLHHASGGMMGVSAAVHAGCALLVPPRFSARAFRADCAAHGASVVQYIGEMARYIVAAHGPAEPRQRSTDEPPLRLRVAFGNGLRPEVWRPFQRALGIRRVVEFYASTEGNVNLFNNTGVVGAVGVVPCFAARLYPLVLARVARGGGDGLVLERDGSTGRCVPCAPGEPGQLLGLISEHDPTRRFDGYTDTDASASKVVDGVAAPGDRYFASGDLLWRDWFGFYYWSDRAGDTYRWKGENVSTAQVATVLTADGSGVLDACVYGVRVPHCDGRAGMAALLLRETGAGLDAAELYRRCASQLPSFALPLFVRLVRSAETLRVTATFKHQKAELQRDGFDPQAVGDDALFMRDDKRRTYVPLSAEHVRDIECGAMRL